MGILFWAFCFFGFGFRSFVLRAVFSGKVEFADRLDHVHLRGRGGSLVCSES